MCVCVWVRKRGGGGSLVAQLFNYFLKSSGDGNSSVTNPAGSRAVFLTVVIHVFPARPYNLFSPDTLFAREGKCMQCSGPTLSQNWTEMCGPVSSWLQRTGGPVLAQRNTRKQNPPRCLSLCWRANWAAQLIKYLTYRFLALSNHYFTHNRHKSRHDVNRFPLRLIFITHLKLCHFMRHSATSRWVAGYFPIGVIRILH